MKKVILSALMGLMVIGLSMAQQRMPHTPEQRAEMQTKRLTKEITLTADQQTQVKSILLNRAVKVDSLRADQTMDKSQRMQQLKAIKDEGDASIQKVLSPEQYKKYLDLQEEQMDKVQQRRQSRQ
ncbi:hypothetical protein QNI19_31765 [Cytophagaceae bacterium DM2B3-1]|uniref:P pilus assembly/Cpx signaling pathway, periplasmic inhibitor/zinc-resistance associated protein n=1 Tax=Xanthocytophaga flava TaxID=3048013 RepID=A0ABT7CV18_9BACT|nr:hypothetical protein [Xanthocytophaga flavus]MDJ1469184.1 hypothetical protein [Xanthocytophaga flavus]MDJ1497560.1 hypothetical protein [Xanthocytophaga flavus]